MLLSSRFCFILLALPFIRRDWRQVSLLILTPVVGICLHFILLLCRRRGWLAFARSWDAFQGCFTNAQAIRLEVWKSCWQCRPLWLDIKRCLLQPGAYVARLPAYQSPLSCLRGSLFEASSSGTKWPLENETPWLFSLTVWTFIIWNQPPWQV